MLHKDAFIDYEPIKNYVNIYEDKYHIHNTIAGIRILLQLAKEQGILISDKGLRNLLKKVRETGSVIDNRSEAGVLSKVTLDQLYSLRLGIQASK